MEKLEQLKSRKQLLDQWEQAQHHLRSLRQDLKQPALRCEDKADIEKDIRNFTKRKLDVGKDLGFY